MPLEQEGISKTHDSVIHLMLLLSDCPSGIDGVSSIKPSNRIYYTKKEAHSLHRTHIED